MPMVCKSKRVSVPNNVVTKIVDVDRTRRHLVLWPETNMWIGGANLANATGYAIVSAHGGMPVPAPACEGEVWASHTGGAAFDMHVLEFCED